MRGKGGERKRTFGQVRFQLSRHVAYRFLLSTPSSDAFVKPDKVSMDDCTTVSPMLNHAYLLVRSRPASLLLNALFLSSADTKSSSEIAYRSVSLLEVEALPPKLQFQTANFFFLCSQFRTETDTLDTKPMPEPPAHAPTSLNHITKQLSAAFGNNAGILGTGNAV